MNIQTCTYEHQVISAVKTGQWSDELREHAKTCTLCSETIVVTAALHQAGQKTLAEARTVASFVLWFRAQFLRKQGRLSNVERCMFVGLLAVALVFLIGTVVWKWQILQTWITNVSEEPVSNLPIYVVAGCAALVWFLTEEVLHGEE